MTASELHRQLDTLQHALADLPPDVREPLDRAHVKFVGAYLALLEENAYLRSESCPRCRRLWAGINEASLS